MDIIQTIREWVNSLSRPARLIVLVGMLVIAGLIVVSIFAFITGRDTKLDFSNGFFYAAGAMFALSALLYFGNRGPRQEEDRAPAAPAESQRGLRPGEESVLEMLRRRRRPRDVPFSSVVLLLAGLALFGLSVGVWYLWPGH